MASGMAYGITSSQTIAAAQASRDDTPKAKLKFLVCGGHPGDPEYGCGGTIVELTKRGHEVVLLYLNDGAWPPTPAPIRVAEAARAAGILNARYIFAGQVNGHAIVDGERYDLYRKILHEEKPDAVITHWPLDNHRDHRACWTLTYDAWRELDRSFALYYYEVSDGEDTLQFSPTHYVNISEAEPLKRAACYAHTSQTPDSYYQLQDVVATFRGIEHGCKRAEAFIMQARNTRDILTLTLDGSGPQRSNSTK
jgi:N-acetylglucosamine malate deacetylase 1